MTNDCKFATDTGRPWCNCRGVVCTEIECRNRARIQAIAPGAEGRSDGANYHTKYAEWDANDRANAQYVLVRSKYCCAQHCVDYASPENNEKE